MKKIKYLMFILLLAVTSFTVSANETNPKKGGNPQEEVDLLEKRVQEIWNMDFSDMDKVQKQTLRSEVKEIKRQLKQASLDSKVSISIGAIIIILLLLIILT